MPQPDKSLVQQQEELAADILEILDIPRHDLDAATYASIRAAIAHYTVSLSELK